MKNFFLESTCVCFIDPWPWSRAFLSLASRVSVLGKAVLGLGFFCVLGLGFFLCPWPWPRALCLRLHLCYKRSKCFRNTFKMTVFSKKKLQELLSGWGLHPQASIHIILFKMSKTFKKTIQMALKWLFFPKKKLLELPNG